MNINEKEVMAVFSKHLSLHDAFKKNATVYAWFKMALLGECTIEEAYVGAIVGLVSENKRIFDELLKAKETE